MPRGKRYILPGHVYHVTHRCHQRKFLLKFKQDRDVYRSMLRDRVARYRISLFNFAVTSNHVHLLLRPQPTASLESLSEFMRSLEGDFAQYYNLRKGRRNAFWGDRYHATMIEPGPHLWRCLLYIDLNMVRAGQVDDPKDWEWAGHRELVGRRRRYCTLDISQLLGHLGGVTLSSFRESYSQAIQDALINRVAEREAIWTESLAVGSQLYVREVGKQVADRVRLDYSQDTKNPDRWRVRETRSSCAYD